LVPFNVNPFVRELWQVFVQKDAPHIVIYHLPF
jgi:hypothetical protein